MLLAQCYTWRQEKKISVNCTCMLDGRTCQEVVCPSLFWALLYFWTFCSLTIEAEITSLSPNYLLGKIKTLESKLGLILQKICLLYRCRYIDIDTHTDDSIRCLYHGVRSLCLPPSFLLQSVCRPTNTQPWSSAADLSTILLMDPHEPHPCGDDLDSAVTIPAVYVESHTSLPLLHQFHSPLHLCSHLTTDLVLYPARWLEKQLLSRTQNNRQASDLYSDL